MTVLDFTGSLARSQAELRSGIALVQVHDSLWRVTLPAGDVLGYIERLVPAEGSRFRAKRYLVSRRSFFSMGEFWTMNDAIECFRIN